MKGQASQNLGEESLQVLGCVIWRWGCGEEARTGFLE